MNLDDMEIAAYLIFAASCLLGGIFGAWIGFSINRSRTERYRQVAQDAIQTAARCRGLYEKEKRKNG